MKAKKRFMLCAAVLTGLLVIVLFVAGCELADEDEVPDTSVFAGHVYVVWPRTTYTYGFSTMPTNLIHSNEIAWNPGTGKVETGQNPSYTGYDEHDPATEPEYQVLKDFLLFPGVEESDTISFDENGKIFYFCKYGPQTPPNSDNYAAAADMEIKIGTSPGQLDPRLFAKTVDIAGWPDAGSDANKTIKVSGKKLSKGSKLILHGFPSGKDTVPYYIYSNSATHNVAVGVNDTYTY
jgi:hypothetical protein